MSDWRGVRGVDVLHAGSLQTSTWSQRASPLKAAAPKLAAAVHEDGEQAARHGNVGQDLPRANLGSVGGCVIQTEAQVNVPVDR